MDSWDGYTSAEVVNYWPTQDPFPGIISSPPRTGSGCFKPAVSGQYRNFPGQSAVVVGVAYNPAVLGSNVFQFLLGGINGTIQVSLRVAFNGVLYIQRGFSGPIIATTDPSLALIPTIYDFIEWKTGFTHSSYNEIRVNGQVLFTGTLDCQNGLLSGADTAVLFGLAGGSVALYDDFYLLSQDGLGAHDFLGDTSIICCIPSADGTYVEWTPGGPGHSTQHYKNVAEIPADGDNSYNASAGSGTRDTYVVNHALNSTDSIQGVQMTQLVHDIDGDNEQARPYISVAGTNYFTSSDNYIAPATYIPAQLKEYDVDPTTGAPWLPSRFNNTVWGIQQV